MVIPPDLWDFTENNTVSGGQLSGRIKSDQMVSDFIHPDRKISFLSSFFNLLPPKNTKPPFCCAIVPQKNPLFRPYGTNKHLES